MADRVLKFGVDISEAQAKLASLRQVFEQLKLSDELGESMLKQFSKIESKMRELAEIELTPDSDEETFKRYTKLTADIKRDTSALAENFSKANRELRLGMDVSAQHLTTLSNIERHAENVRETYRQQKEQVQAQLEVLQKTKHGKQILIREGLIGSEKLSQQERENAKANLESNEELRETYQQILALRQEIDDIETREAASEVKLEALEKEAKRHEDKLNIIREVETAQRGVREVTEEMDETARREADHFTQQQKKKEESLDAVSKQIGTITERMKRLIEFTVAAFALRQLRRFIQEGLRFVRDLDKSLTEIATVTHQTRQAMWQMAEEFNRMGRELGRTTNEIAQASVLFYRQGLQTHEVMEMVRASTISAGIANTETAEASDRLTAALRGFLLPANAAMSVSDKLAALAAQSASSFDELSYAMTKTAASAHVAGIDMDHLFAYIAKVVEATRYEKLAA